MNNLTLVMTIITTVLEHLVTKGYYGNIKNETNIANIANLSLQQSIDKLFNFIRVDKEVIKTISDEKILSDHKKTINKMLEIVNETKSKYKIKDSLAVRTPINLDEEIRLLQKPLKIYPRVSKIGLGFDDWKRFLNTIDKTNNEFLTNMTDGINNKSSNLIGFADKINIEVSELNQQTTRINVGRRTTLITKYPFVVSIHRQGVFLGTGSIISKKIVLTAASIFRKKLGKIIDKDDSYRVRYGSNNAFQGGDVLVSQLIFQHPAYNANDPLKHNIALLQTQREFITGPKVSVIHLDAYANSDSDNIDVLGWGGNSPNEKVMLYQNKGHLTQATLKIYNFEDCKSKYSKNSVTDFNFCVGYTTQGTSVCKGDKGGPGIYKGKLIGVISFGSPICGVNDPPTVLTRVDWYALWIFAIREFSEANPNYPEKNASESSMKGFLKFYNTDYDSAISSKSLKPQSTKTTNSISYTKVDNHIQTKLGKQSTSQTSTEDILYPEYKNYFKETFSSTTPVLEKARLFSIYYANMKKYTKAKSTTTASTIPIHAQHQIKTSKSEAVDSVAEYDATESYTEKLEFMPYIRT